MTGSSARSPDLGRQVLHYHQHRQRDAALTPAGVGQLVAEAATGDDVGGVNMANRPGALVISLDFELHWGVRDHVTRNDALYGRLPEARTAVTRHARALRGTEHPRHMGHRRVPLRFDP